MRWPFVVTSALALACVAPVASATPDFPPEIHKHLGLSSDPPCTICHSNPSGGAGTVTQPFGQSMRAHGLEPSNIGSLDAALDALEKENVDSDGDGTPDIAELKAGSDPNSASGALESGPTPAYGCGASARIAAGGPLDTVAASAAAIALLGLVLARRRTRR